MKHYKENSNFLSFIFKGSQRQFKVNELDAILVKLYRCMACGKLGNFQLKRHLDSHPNCFQYFKTKFKVNDWMEIKSKLFNLISPAYASRSASRRKVVNAAYSNKKREAKTVTEGLNEFLMTTSLANYRRCVVCDQFFLSSGAIEIKTTDPLYEELNLAEKEELKIMNSYWLCLLCKSSNTKHEESLTSPVMKSIQIEGRTIVYPTNENQGGDIDINFNTLILFPSSYRKSNYEKNWSVNIYSNPEPTNQYVSTLYKKRMEKFVARFLYSDFYTGEIMLQQHKKLQSISKVVDESSIRSSQAWIQKRKNAIFSNFQQYGQVAISYSINMDVNNAETIMTTFLCNGDVLSLDFQGDVNDEFATKYKKHNHGKNVTCNVNCDTTEISAINEFLQPKFTPVLLSSISQKHTGFIQKFIRNKNFDLFSEDYFSGVDFNLTGGARLNGILWTFECNIFNKELASSSLDGKELEVADFLHYLERTILTTANKVCIKNTLGINEDETNKIHNLAQMYQVNLNMKKESVSLPSYESLIRRAPDELTRSNAQSSKTFLQLMKKCLLDLSEEDKISLTTEAWLDNISRKAKFDVHEENTVYIDFEDTIISFAVNETLTSMMNKYGAFIGLYHFCLTCTNKQMSFVLRRLHILDCFTVPYNSTLLKAFQNKIELKPIYSISQWWNFQEKYSEQVPDLENTELSEFTSTHSLVSLTEMYALSDPTKVRDIISSSIEYIAPYQNQKPKFRKLRVSTEDSYELAGIGYFEMLSNNIHRHFTRKNGKELLMVETGLWYDVMPKKDGKEIYDMYKERPERIPDGEILGIYGKWFPTFILCENGQILKLRRTRKCLQTPQFKRLSKEEKYARVILFYPLKPFETVDIDRINDYYYATNNSVRDSSGQVLSIIEINERYIS